MPASRINKIAHQERAARVLELAKTGMSFPQIAKVMDCHLSTVGRLYAFAMEQTIRPAADSLRALMLEQLHGLLRSIWLQAITPGKGQMAAIDRARGILADIRDLEGMNAPIRTEIRVITEETIDAEIAKLRAEMAELDPENLERLRAADASTN